MPVSLHSPSVTRRTYLSVLLLCVLLAVVLAILPEAIQHRLTTYYPLIHGTLETISLITAGSIFAIIWRASDETLPMPLPLLGAGFAAIATFDFSHLMSSANMPWANLGKLDTALLELASRPLTAVLLLVLAFMPWEKILHHGRRQFWFAVTLIASLLTLCYWLILPLSPALVTAATLHSTTPFPGSGIEAASSLLSLLAALLFFRRYQHSTDIATLDLAAAAMLGMLGSLVLAFQHETAGPNPLLAHACKLAAYLLIFMAVYKLTVQRPHELLRHSEQRLAATLKALPDLVFEMDLAGNYLAVHSGNQGELAAPEEELVGENVNTHLPPSQAKIVLAAIDEANRHGFARAQRFQLDVVDGRRLWFELSVVATPNLASAEPRFLLISRDVTANEEQRQRLLSLSMAVEQSPASIIITDSKLRIQYVNASFTHSSGYQPEEVIGLHPRFLHSAQNRHDLEEVIKSHLTQGQHWRGEIHCLSKGGREFTESVLLYAIHDERGKISNFLAIKEDISAQLAAAENLRQLSHYDQLTGLPNRQLLAELFTHLRSESYDIAALWIDLDHFKDVNDALGHSMGDLLLQEVSRRLRNTLRVQDVLCRVSGDDFIVLLPDADQNLAAAMSRWLIYAMRPSIELNQHNISMTASIGIALCPDDALDLESLLQKAEMAMYRMKQAGRNDYSFFAAEMQEQAIRNLTLSNALKQALSRDEFHLVYQPQLSLIDQRIVGAEVLLRWNYPPWGAISPAEFIPLAEASGQIVAIGEWVLEQAMQQLRTWLNQGYDISLAINLSAVQFEHPSLSETLHRVLASCDIPAGRLELELTEAVAMKTPALAVERMSELSRLGIKLAIDDFGTGYSSLSYLKRFKIHKLKIDQSFVQDLEDDIDDRAIATAIIQMAHGLGVITIAEGVETIEQLRWLAAQQCDQIQGYHLSRPLQAADFETFLQTHSGLAKH